MKSIVILYHADCPDGFGAAWAAWKHFGKKADYIPIYHQTPPPKGLTGKNIYQLDITYFGKDLTKLLQANTVTTIDHHISAKDTIEKAHQFYYALENSGAVLAWKFFHAQKPVPWLLRYVEDNDLWKFALPRSREITTVIPTTVYDFKSWDSMMKKMEKPEGRKEYANMGAAMVKYQERLVQELVSKADEAIFAGKKIGVVNCAASDSLKSYVGAALIKKGYPFAVIWQRFAKTVKVSLRSGGKVDVSKTAKRFGGGGHMAAASFWIKASKKLPWRYTRQ